MWRSRDLPPLAKVDRLVPETQRGNLRIVGSYLRLIDSCITQLKAQGPARTCNESKEEEDGQPARGAWPDAASFLINRARARLFVNRARERLLVQPRTCTFICF